jgi:hypothetical protein
MCSVSGAKWGCRSWGGNERNHCADAEIQGGFPETSFASLSRIIGSVIGSVFPDEPGNPFVSSNIEARLHDYIQTSMSRDTKEAVLRDKEIELREGVPSPRDGSAAMCELSEETVEALREAAVQCERAALIGWSIESSIEPESTVEHVKAVMDLVGRLKHGEAVLLPIVWRTMQGGHATAALVEGGDGSVRPRAKQPGATEESPAEFVLTAINTGSGLKFHPTGGSVSLTSTKFLTAMALAGLPREKVLLLPKWINALYFQRQPSGINGPRNWYASILQSFSSSSPVPHILEAEKRGLHGPPSEPQRSGSCYYRCALASVKHLLFRHGISKEQRKRATLAIRVAMLLRAKQQLEHMQSQARDAEAALDAGYLRDVAGSDKEPVSLLPHEAKILATACSQLVRTAGKLVDAGSLPHSAANDVRALAAEVRRLVIGLDAGHAIGTSVAEALLLDSLESKGTALTDRVLARMRAHVAPGLGNKSEPIEGALVGFHGFDTVAEQRPTTCFLGGAGQLPPDTLVDLQTAEIAPQDARGMPHPEPPKTGSWWEQSASELRKTHGGVLAVLSRINQGCASANVLTVRAMIEHFVLHVLPPPISPLEANLAGRPTVTLATGGSRFATPFAFARAADFADCATTAAEGPYDPWGREGETSPLRLSEQRSVLRALFDLLTAYTAVVRCMTTYRQHHGVRVAVSAAIMSHWQAVARTITTGTDAMPLSLFLWGLSPGTKLRPLASLSDSAATTVEVVSSLRYFWPFRGTHCASLAEWTEDSIVTSGTALAWRLVLTEHEASLKVGGAKALAWDPKKFAPLTGAYIASIDDDEIFSVFYQLGIEHYYETTLYVRRLVEHRSITLGAPFVRGFSLLPLERTCAGYVVGCMLATNHAQEPELAQFRILAALSGTAAVIGDATLSTFSCNGLPSYIRNPECVVRAEDADGAAMVDYVGNDSFFSIFASGPPVSKHPRKRCIDPATMMATVNGLSKKHLAAAKAVTVGSMTEDHILRAEQHPTLGGSLSAQEAEEFMCILTSPALRAPLLLQFFASGRLGAFCNPSALEIVERVLFCPGVLAGGAFSTMESGEDDAAEVVSKTVKRSRFRGGQRLLDDETSAWLEHRAASVEQVPFLESDAEALKGTPRGSLCEDLATCPASILRPLVSLARSASDMCTAKTASSFYSVFQSIVRVMVRVAMVAQEEKTRLAARVKTLESMSAGSIPRLEERLESARTSHHNLSEETKALEEWLSGPCMSRLLLLLGKVGKVASVRDGVAIRELEALSHDAERAAQWRELGREMLDEGDEGEEEEEEPEEEEAEAKEGDEEDQEGGGGGDEEDVSSKSKRGAQAHRLVIYGHIAALVGALPTSCVDVSLAATLLAASAHVTAWLHLNSDFVCSTTNSYGGGGRTTILGSPWSDGPDSTMPGVEVYSAIQQHREHVCRLLAEADPARRAAIIRLAVASGLNQNPKDVEKGNWGPAATEEGPLCQRVIETAHPVSNAFERLCTVRFPGAAWIRVKSDDRTELDQSSSIEFLKDASDDSSRWIETNQQELPGARGRPALLVPDEQITVAIRNYARKGMKYSTEPPVADSMPGDPWGVRIVVEAPVCRDWVGVLVAETIPPEVAETIRSAAPAGHSVPHTWPEPWVVRALAACGNDLVAARSWLVSRAESHLSDDAADAERVEYNAKRAFLRGLFTSASGEITFNAQTGEVLLQGRTLERLPQSVLNAPELQVLSVQVDEAGIFLHPVANMRFVRARRSSPEEKSRRKSLKRRLMRSRKRARLNILLGALIRRYEGASDWKVLHGPYSYTIRVWTTSYGPASPAEQGVPPPATAEVLLRSLRAPRVTFRPDFDSSMNEGVTDLRPMRANDAVVTDVEDLSSDDAAASSSATATTTAEEVSEEEAELMGFSASPSLSVHMGALRHSSVHGMKDALPLSGPVESLPPQQPGTVFFWGQPLMQDGIMFYRGQRFSRGLTPTSLGMVGKLLSEGSGIMVGDSWQVRKIRPATDFAGWISDGLADLVERSPVWRAAEHGEALKDGTVASLEDSSRPPVDSSTLKLPVLGRILLCVNHDPDGYEGRDAIRWLEIEVLSRRAGIRVFVILERARRLIRALASNSEAFRDIDALPIAFHERQNLPHPLLRDSGAAGQHLDSSSKVLTVPMINQFSQSSLYCGSNTWRSGQRAALEIWRRHVGGDSESTPASKAPLESTPSTRALPSTKHRGFSSLERLVSRFSFRGLLPMALLQAYRFFARPVPLDREFRMAKDGVWTRPVGIIVGYAEGQSCKAVRFPTQTVLVVRLFERQFRAPDASLPAVGMLSNPPMLEEVLSGARRVEIEAVVHRLPSALLDHFVEALAVAPSGGANTCVELDQSVFPCPEFGVETLAPLHSTVDESPLGRLAIAASRVDYAAYTLVWMKRCGESNPMSMPCFGEPMQVDTVNLVRMGITFRGRWAEVPGLVGDDAIAGLTKQWRLVCDELEGMWWSDARPDPALSILSRVKHSLVLSSPSGGTALLLPTWGMRTKSVLNAPMMLEPLPVATLPATGRDSGVYGSSDSGYAYGVMFGDEAYTIVHLSADGTTVVPATPCGAAALLLQLLATGATQQAREIVRLIPTDERFSRSMVRQVACLVGPANVLNNNDPTFSLHDPCALAVALHVASRFLRSGSTSSSLAGTVDRLTEDGETVVHIPNWTFHESERLLEAYMTRAAHIPEWARISPDDLFEIPSRRSPVPVLAIALALSKAEHQAAKAQELSASDVRMAPVRRPVMVRDKFQMTRPMALAPCDIVVRFHVPTALGITISTDSNGSLDPSRQRLSFFQDAECQAPLRWPLGAEREAESFFTGLSAGLNPGREAEETQGFGRHGFRGRRMFDDSDDEEPGADDDEQREDSDSGEEGAEAAAAKKKGKGGKKKKKVHVGARRTKALSHRLWATRPWMSASRPGHSFGDTFYMRLVCLPPSLFTAAAAASLRPESMPGKDAAPPTATPAAAASGASGPSSTDDATANVEAGAQATEHEVVLPEWVWTDPAEILQAWELASTIKTADDWDSISSDVPARIVEACRAGIDASMPLLGSVEGPASWRGMFGTLTACVPRIPLERSAAEHPKLVAEQVTESMRISWGCRSLAGLEERTALFRGVEVSITATLFPSAEQKEPLFAERWATVHRASGPGSSVLDSALTAWSTAREPREDFPPDTLLTEDPSAPLESQSWMREYTGLSSSLIVPALTMTLPEHGKQPLLSSLCHLVSGRNSRGISQSGAPAAHDPTHSFGSLLELQHGYNYYQTAAYVYEVGTGRGMQRMLGAPVSIDDLVARWDRRETDPDAFKGVTAPTTLADCNPFSEQPRSCALASKLNLAKCEQDFNLTGHQLSRHGNGEANGVTSTTNLAVVVLGLSAIHVSFAIHEAIEAGEGERACKYAKWLSGLPDLFWLMHTNDRNAKEELSPGGKRYECLLAATPVFQQILYEIVFPKELGESSMAGKTDSLLRAAVSPLKPTAVSRHLVPVPLDRVPDLVNLPSHAMRVLRSSSTSIVEEDGSAVDNIRLKLSEGDALLRDIGYSIDGDGGFLQLLTRPLAARASVFTKRHVRGLSEELVSGDEAIPARGLPGDDFDGSNKEAAAVLPFVPPTAWDRTRMSSNDIRRMAHDIVRSKAKVAAAKEGSAGPPSLQCLPPTLLKHIAQDSAALVDAAFVRHDEASKKELEDILGELSSARRVLVALAVGLREESEEASRCASLSAAKAVLGWVAEQALKERSMPLQWLATNSVPTVSEVAKETILDRRTALARIETSSPGFFVLIAMMLSVSATRSAAAAASAEALGERIERIQHLLAASATGSPHAELLDSMGPVTLSFSESAGGREAARQELSGEVAALKPATGRFAGELLTRRWCVKPVGTDWAGATQLSHSGVCEQIARDGAVDLDPRAIAFEFATGLLLRRRQVELVHEFLVALGPGGPGASVIGAQMGLGKSSVVSPLLAACVSDGASVVAAIVPEALLEMSRSAQRKALRGPLARDVQTLRFERFALPTIDLLSLDIEQEEAEEAKAAKEEESKEQSDKPRKLKLSAEADAKRWPRQTPVDPGVVLTTQASYGDVGTWVTGQMLPPGFRPLDTGGFRVAGGLREAWRLCAQMDGLARTGGVLVTTPEAVKSLMLQFVDTLHTANALQSRADDYKRSLAEAVIADLGSTAAAPADETEDAKEARLKKEAMKRKVERADRDTARSCMARAQLCVQLSEALGGCLQRLCAGGVALIDEVDLVMSPLKSELVFPTGDRSAVDLAPARWDLGMHVVELFITAAARAAHATKTKKLEAPEALAKISSTGSQADAAGPLLRRASSWLGTVDLPEGVRLGHRLLVHLGTDNPTEGELEEAEHLCNSLEAVVTEGLELSALQRQPHIVLLSKRFYAAKILPILIPWAMLWLKRREAMSGIEAIRAKLAVAASASTDEESKDDESSIDPALVLSKPMKALPEHASVEAIISGARLDGPDAMAITRTHSGEAIRLISAMRTWLTNIAPHCMSKANRINFGLLDDAVAGHFASKSNGDDQDERSSKRMEPPSRRFLAVPFVALDTPSPSSEFAQPDVRIAMTFLAFRYEGLRRHDTMMLVMALKRSLVREHGPVHLRPSFLRFDRWLAGTAGSSSAEEGAPVERSVLPLDLLQPSDRAQADRCHSALRRNPDAISHYLRTRVFPTVLRSQAERLAASGVDIAGGAMFRKRVGFSGTPSDLLPRGMSCQFEPGSEAEIALTLSNPEVVQVHRLPKRWSAHSLLRWFASHDPPLQALIDVGALVTNMSNIEVARTLLSEGLSWAKGVVFVSQDGRQRILLRGQEDGEGSDLAGSGVGASQRVTFYDQVHTTGVDVRQALDARAAVTVGKDVTLRDYAQGAWRMRQIGQGQSMVTIVPPEVSALIFAASKAAATTALSRVQSESSTAIASVASEDDTALGLGDGRGLGREASVPESSDDIPAPEPRDVLTWLMGNSLKAQTMQLLQLSQQQLGDLWRGPALRALLKAPPPALLSGEDPVALRVAFQGPIAAGGTRFSSFQTGIPDDRAEDVETRKAVADAMMTKLVGARNLHFTQQLFATHAHPVVGAELLRLASSIHESALPLDDSDGTTADLAAEARRLRAAVACFVAPLEMPVPSVLERPSSFSEALREAATEAQQKGWLSLSEAEADEDGLPAGPAKLWRRSSTAHSTEHDGYELRATASTLDEAEAIIAQAADAEAALGLLGATRDVLSRDREMVTQLQLEVDDESEAQRQRNILTEMEKESEGQWAEAAKGSTRWLISDLETVCSEAAKFDGSTSAETIAAGGGALFALKSIEPLGAQGTVGTRVPSFFSSSLWVSENHTPRLRPPVGRRRLRNCMVALGLPKATLTTDVTVVLSLEEAATIRRLIQLRHPMLFKYRTSLVALRPLGDPVDASSTLLAHPRTPVEAHKVPPELVLSGKTQVSVFEALLFDASPAVPKQILPWLAGSIARDPTMRGGLQKLFEASVAARVRDAGDWSSSSIEAALEALADHADGSEEPLDPSESVPLPLSVLLPESLAATQHPLHLEAENTSQMIRDALEFRLFRTRNLSRAAEPAAAAAAAATPVESKAPSSEAPRATFKTRNVRAPPRSEAEAIRRLAKHTVPTKAHAEMSRLAGVGGQDIAWREDSRWFYAGQALAVPTTVVPFGIVLHRGCGVIRWEVRVDRHNRRRFASQALRADPSTESANLVRVGVICASWEVSDSEFARIGDKCSHCAVMSSSEDEALRPLAPSVAVGSDTPLACHEIECVSTASTATTKMDTFEGIRSGDIVGVTVDTDQGRLWISVNGRGLDLGALKEGATDRALAAPGAEWEPFWALDVSALTEGQGLGVVPAVTVGGDWACMFLSGDTPHTLIYPPPGPSDVSRAAFSLVLVEQAKRAKLYAVAEGYGSGRWGTVSGATDLMMDDEKGGLWVKPRVDGVEKGGRRAGGRGAMGGDGFSRPITAFLAGPSPLRGRWYWELEVTEWMGPENPDVVAEERAKSLANAMSRMGNQYFPSPANAGVRAGAASGWIQLITTSIPFYSTRRQLTSAFGGIAEDDTACEGRQPTSLWNFVSLQSPVETGLALEDPQLLLSDEFVDALSEGIDTKDVALPLRVHGLGTGRQSRDDSTGSKDSAAAAAAAASGVSSEDDGSDLLSATAAVHRWRGHAHTQSWFSWNKLATGASFGAPGDVIGVAVDYDSGMVSFSLNGSWDEPWGNSLRTFLPAEPLRPMAMIGPGYCVRPRVGKPGVETSKFLFAPPKVKDDQVPYLPFGEFQERLPFEGNLRGPWLHPWGSWEGALPAHELAGAILHGTVVGGKPLRTRGRRSSMSSSDPTETFLPEVNNLEAVSAALGRDLELSSVPTLLEQVGVTTGIQFAFAGRGHTASYPTHPSDSVERSLGTIVSAPRNMVGIRSGRYVYAVQLLSTMPAEVGWIVFSTVGPISGLGLATDGKGCAFSRPSGTRAIALRDATRRVELARSPQVAKKGPGLGSRTSAEENAECELLLPPPKEEEEELEEQPQADEGEAAEELPPPAAFGQAWQPDDVLGLGISLPGEDGSVATVRIARKESERGPWVWSKPHPVTFSLEEGEELAVRPAVLMVNGCGARFAFGGPHDPIPRGLLDEATDEAGGKVLAHEPVWEAFSPSD